MSMCQCWVDIVKSIIIRPCVEVDCTHIMKKVESINLLLFFIYIYIIIQPTKKIYWIELAMSIQARFEKYFDVESTLRRCCASIYQNNVDISSIREIFRCWIDIEATLCLDIQYAQNYSTYNCDVLLNAKIPQKSSPHYGSNLSILLLGKRQLLYFLRVTL